MDTIERIALYKSIFSQIISATQRVASFDQSDRRTEEIDGMRWDRGKYSYEFFSSWRTHIWHFECNQGGLLFILDVDEEGLVSSSIYNGLFIYHLRELYTAILRQYDMSFVFTVDDHNDQAAQRRQAERDAFLIELCDHIQPF